MAANSLQAKIDYTQEQVLAADARIRKRSSRWITASSALRSTELSFPRTHRWEKWFAQFGRRRFHAHRHRDDCRYGFERNRSRRQ